MMFGCSFLGCMRRTVVRSVILVQASSSRLGESIRVLTATRTRLGDQSTFWATPCLAQARRSRLSENSWRPPIAYLAWARIRCVSKASVSPERVCECVTCFPDCLGDSLYLLVRLFPPKNDVRDYTWVFGFLWTKLACLVWDWSWVCGFVMF